MDDLNAWCYEAIEATATRTQKHMLCYLSVGRRADRLFKVQCGFLNYHSFLGFFLFFTCLNNQGDTVCERLVG